MRCRKWLLLLTGLFGAWGMSAPARAAHPGMDAWEIAYDKPEEVKEVWLHLRYRFWDPKVDGDVPSRRELETVRLKAAPQRLRIAVFAGPGGSAIRVNDLEEQGGGAGIALGSSYVKAARPKPNSDGVYVLAQAPGDPRHPAALGDTQNATAWIELEIELRP